MFLSKFKKARRKKVFFVILVALASYYFIPPIFFWLFAAPAEMSDNNQSNIEKLKNNQNATFSFIVFGDNHAGLFFHDVTTLKLISHINREDRFGKMPIDFVLNTGDVTLCGKPSQFLAFKKEQKLIKYPLFAAIGNHENKENKLFEKYMGKTEFAFADRNSYFIIIDNTENELTDNQFEWFEKCLIEGQKYEHIFVVAHKPAFIPYFQSRQVTVKSGRKWAYKFRNLCTKYKVDMVFSGHYHMFKHEKIDGVDYIATGGGGGTIPIEIPESDGGYFHYVRVVVDNRYVGYEVRKVSPPLWVYFSYYFWKEAAYWVLR
ncbi:MAG: metallophosphoesterase [Sedimentisphaerales bacterium]